MSAVNSFARSAFSVSGSSGLYDRARPSYPSAALNAILERLPSSGKVDGVEVGTGTGIFTRALIAAAPGRFDSLRCTEPSEGMRAGFEKAMAQHKPAVTIADGDFEHIPASDQSADALFAAQAFHWVTRPGYDGADAVEELARVLKSGASAFLIWNLEDRRTPWVGQIRDVYEAHEAGTPQYRHGHWKSIFNTQAYSTYFEPPVELNYEQKLPATADIVTDRIGSKSYITALAQKERDEVMRKLRDIVEAGEGKTWIDKPAGIFEWPYVTDLFVLKRKS